MKNMAKLTVRAARDRSRRDRIRRSHAKKMHNRGLGAAGAEVGRGWLRKDAMHLVAHALHFSGPVSWERSCNWGWD